MRLRGRETGWRVRPERWSAGGLAVDRSRTLSFSIRSSGVNSAFSPKVSSY